MTAYDTRDILADAADGGCPADAAALRLAGHDELSSLLRTAARVRDLGHGRTVSYSRKVFIPLTQLCRDVCHYCTFARPPRKGERCFLTPDEVLAIARAGAAAGCQEALFTLGDKPELRYRAARDELAALGFDTTLAYLTHVCALVLRETGLLPHTNPGAMSPAEIAALREVSVSQGIMLETASCRLGERGLAHHGSPDKVPAVRLRTIADAGALAVPFTTGILIGIGETRLERIEALLALRELHDRHGHLQEVIIQNFRAKAGTRMAGAAEPSIADHQWTIAVARILFGAEMTIQAPPNLQAGGLTALIDAGVNDWGGVSPVTPDHVNPEAPWPGLDQLAEQTREAGKTLVQRLAIYPAFARDASRWTSPDIARRVRDNSDATGYARTDDWLTGRPTALPAVVGFAHDTRSACAASLPRAIDGLDRILDRATSGKALTDGEIVQLFSVHDDDVRRVTEAADTVRQAAVGDVVRYVVNRNINYTNVCTYRCRFCAFSKGKTSENLRGKPYVLDLDEVERRAREAWDRGATEVCLQGGIHPAYTGQTYLDICTRLKAALPDLHIHAFSPLEVWQGAATTHRTVPDFLRALRDAGLSSLPGTAAEILDDEVRDILCPDKINTAQWLSVMKAAHEVGLRSTATIMFGHVDHPLHWARHIRRIRTLQEQTGGFTEFVPLPFVPHEAPIYLKGLARRGPTWRECLLMHAVARLALHPMIPNIQTSWVKLGPEGAAACLRAGANDLGGTLMNETITRSAGAAYGQEFSPEEMEALIAGQGRSCEQRTTFYGTPDAERTTRSFNAPGLTNPVLTPAKAVKFPRQVARVNKELSS